MLDFSEACERNKVPILRILVNAFRGCAKVLEIGSGTAQHAVYFAAHLPQLVWQPSDLPEYLPAISARLELESPANVLPPLALDVREHPWPKTGADAVFSANTLPIMAWDGVVHFFRGAGELLGAGGILCVYGPFRYADKHTSESNAWFDASLKRRDPYSGIRNFEDIDELAARQELCFRHDYTMPANNRLLVWEKSPAE
jgi:hypothetical protein